MNGEPSPDPEVLGRILLLQSTLQAATDERSMAEMLTHGIAAIPGVNGCITCIGGSTVRNAETKEALEFLNCPRAGEIPDASFSCPANFCVLADGTAWQRFPLRTPRREYGVLYLNLRDQATFELYLDFVENTANLVALHIENARGAEELTRLNRSLEEQVRFRTRQLQESESKLRESQQMAHLGHWYWDVKTGDVEWSEEVYRIFHLDPEKFTPHIDSIMELSPWPEDHQRDKELIEKAMIDREKGSYEQRFLFPDGSTGYYFSTFQGVYDDGDDLIAIQGTVQDITERKQAEAELAATTSFLNTIVDMSPFAMWVSDSNGTIIRTNRSLRETLNVTDEQIVGRYNVMSDENLASEDILPKVRAVFEKHEPACFSTPWRVAKAGGDFAGGRDLYIDVSLFPILNNEGELEHVVCQWVDITERNRAKREREELISKLEAQNEELERFTYTVSHDLKSPLITIKGYVGMLRQDLGEAISADVESDLERISRAADKMDRLLKDLLELSRIGRLVNPPEEVSLEKLSHEVAELLAGMLKKRGVRIEISPDLPVLFGDRIRLFEVVQNLVDNAVKYMGDQSSPLVEIGSRIEGEEMVCYVRDNGMGIDPRYQDKIFGLFEQLDQQAEGSGIGLSLVKRIVEVHGGRMWVESNGLGRGATFCFTIADKEGSPQRLFSERQTETVKTAGGAKC